MYFDFVDIGTCDFETSAHIANKDQKVLLVEPLEFYLHRVPSSDNTIKANLAVGDSQGYIDVKFVPENVIQKYNLPYWIKGCSNVGQGYHNTVARVFAENNLPLSLIETRKVETLTFYDLCMRYSVTSIGFLKIDTEGYEQYILPNVLEQVKNGFQIGTLKYENQASLGNKVFVDYLTTQFLNNGFEIVEINQTDTTLRKR